MHVDSSSSIDTEKIIAYMVSRDKGNDRNQRIDRSNTEFHDEELKVLTGPSFYGKHLR